MQVEQGEKELTIRQKTDMLLDVIFPDDDPEPEPYSVSNNGKEGTGKIYLTIHTSLSTLANTKFPFKWDAEVRENKVVIHF